MQTNKTRIEEVFDLGPEIAKGRFAKVRILTRRSDGALFAGKFQSKRRAAKHIEQEIQVHKMCSSHARFPTFHDIYETSTELVIIMDYASGGEIYPYCVGTDPLNPDDEDSEGAVFTEGDVIRYTRQLLEAVQFLHVNNILHLDIKPHNILLSAPYPEGDILLVDFGLSRQLDKSGEQRVFAGTPDYLAPELVSYDPVSTATDVWSVGVVCYVMLTGQSPFAGDTAQQTSNNICNIDYHFPADLFESISHQAQDFIQSIFKKNPKHRSTIDELLNHPWLKPSNSQNLQNNDVYEEQTQHVEKLRSPPPKSISSPGGIVTSPVFSSSQSALFGDVTSRDASNQKNDVISQLLPSSYSADAIGKYFYFSEEHSNSSDSAVGYSDEDQFSQDSPELPKSLPNKCNVGAKIETRTKTEIKSPRVIHNAKSRDSTPVKLSDFKRLSLKRRSSEKY